jgi:HSP20 family protein
MNPDSLFAGKNRPGHQQTITEEVDDMLMRFDPFREFDRLTQQVWGGRPAAMPMDAYRSGDQFVVHFDLPGVDSSSIDLTVQQHALSVTAQRSWQPVDGGEVIASERPQGTFTRQLFLSDDLDLEHIEANYEQGVLTLRIPVPEQAKPRKVEITSGRQQKSIEATSTETSTAA